MFAATRASMIARLLLLGAVSLVTMGAQSSCSASYGDPGGAIDDPGGSGAGPTFTTTLVLKNSAGTLTDHFGRGELITFELAVRNRTDTAATVHFGSDAQTDYLVFNDGSHVVRWRWTAGRVFTPLLTDLTFQPHETKTFTFDWDQVLTSGAMLEIGSFEARGLLPHTGADPDPLASDELASILVPFAITG